MQSLKISEEKGCYRFDSFSNFPIVAVFSDRTFDMRFAEDTLSGSNDRQAFCEMLKIPGRDLVCLEQIHGANIVLVTSEMKGRGATHRQDALAKADGAIVRERCIPTGVQTADCASVFLYDPKNETVGIAHVGWRGLYAGITEKMVAAFTNNFKCRPKDLLVGLGPMIRKCCYEVGEDVASFFGSFVIKRRGKIYLDLTNAIINALHAKGVKKTNIEDMGFCTSCHNELFYSHRREGNLAGRTLSVIMLA